MMLQRLPFLGLLITLVTASGFAATPQSESQIHAAVISTPMVFEPNQGQSDPEVAFQSRGPGYQIFLTRTESVIVLHSRKTAPDVIRMELVGARPADPVGESKLESRTNYLLGAPSEWRTNIPNFARVRAKDVLPAIDVVYYGNGRGLEYDLVLRPGAKVDAIHWNLAGARPQTGRNGDLLLKGLHGTVVFRAPVAYQLDALGKRQPVHARYELDGNEVGFRVASYDPRRALIIDPSLSYSSYLGGSGDDNGLSIAVDSNGRAYVAGDTYSSNFPRKGGFSYTPPSGFETAFLTKMWANGQGVIFSTYLNAISVEGVAVDRSANIYVAGGSNPGTPGAQIGPNGSAGQAWVAKINPSGTAFLWSLKFGGSNGADTFALAIDSAGHAYVTGATSSSDFPTTSLAYQKTFGGSDDAFVVKTNSAGTGFDYATYLGGGGQDLGEGIAVDGNGSAYVTGQNFNGGYPTTGGAFMPNPPAKNPCDKCVNGTAVVSKLNSAGSTLLYSTYLGGSGNDGGRGIAVDSTGHAYLIGSTESTNFPTTAGAYRRSDPDPTGDSAFVTKLSADGSALSYSTYLGGSGGTLGESIAVNSSGQAFVTGTTNGGFPIKNGFQTTNHGQDAFIAKLWATGGGLLWSSYLGGSNSDIGWAIRLDANGNAYVTGNTQSANFPTTTGAFDRTYGGTQDAFVVKIAP